MTDLTNPLAPEQMRALGYHVIDTLVEHLETLPAKAVTRNAVAW